MNVHVHPRLPRRLANIYSDVESIGRMLGACEPVRLAKKLENGELFFRRHFEEIRHVSLRHNENVTAAE